jgi:tRNA (uracil-5-)-methyltransferase TRM9
MGVKATQPEGPNSENDLDDRNGKGSESEERIDEKIQDVLVPWVLRSKPKLKPKPTSKPKSKSLPRSESKPSSTPLPNQDENGNGNTTSDQVDEEDRADQGKEEQREEEEKEEEEKVFNRYYHLFVEGELRDLIHQAGMEEGYRILPPISPSLSSSTSTSPSSLPSSTPTPTCTKNSQDQDGAGGKWLRIRGEGWEADNWWVEAEVGVGDGQ